MDEENKSWLRFVPGFIRNDFPRKLIALFFALLVYAIVVNKIGTTVNIQGVPVDVTVPAELVNMDSTTPKLTVTLRGSERWLSRIVAGDIKIKTKVEENKFIPDLPYSLKINPEDIKLPIGVRLVNYSPQEVLLVLEPKIARPIPIKAKFNSVQNLPSDYVVGKVKLNPNSAMVTGPKSVVEKIQMISTEPIPLDGSTVESFEFQVKLADHYPGVKITPDTVTAEVEIIKEYLSRTFKSIPIRVLREGDQKLRCDFVATPHTDITVSGPKGQISKLTDDRIRPYVDISTLDKPGSYMVDIRCWIDFPGVTVQGMSPRQAQINLTDK